MTQDGSQFKVGLVKSEIIELVLSNSGPISEPWIRKEIGNKHGSIDQSVVSKHLKALRSDDFKCVELILPKNKSRFNYFDITTIKTLKSIMDKFPEIHLNEYEKSSSIVFENAKRAEINRGLKHIVNYIPFPEQMKAGMTKRFKLSPAYFDLFFDYPSNSESFKNFDMFVKLLIEEYGSADKEIDEKIKGWERECGHCLRVPEGELDATFIACVYIDVLKGQSNPEAIEYMRKLKIKLKPETGL